MAKEKEIEYDRTAYSGPLHKELAGLKSIDYKLRKLIKELGRLSAEELTYKKG